MIGLKWDEIEEKSKRMGGRVTHVLQEEVQKAILTSLSREEAFNSIVFQGGTCLRVFYDSKRFSEDLDFLLRAGTNAYDMRPHVEGIRDFLLTYFPFFVAVTADVKVDRHDFQKIVLKINGERRIHYVRIHLETAFVPSWEHTLDVLHFQVYAALVRIQALEELLAEKIHAFLSRSYLKGRDLWDMHYLFDEKGVTIPWQAVIKRSQAYGDLDPSSLQTRLRTRCKALREKGEAKLHDAMERFLLAPYYEAYKDDVGEIINTIEKKLKNLLPSAPTSQDGTTPGGG